MALEMVSVIEMVGLLSNVKDRWDTVQDFPSVKENAQEEVFNVLSPLIEQAVLSTNLFTNTNAMAILNSVKTKLDYLVKTIDRIEAHPRWCKWIRPVKFGTKLTKTVSAIHNLLPMLNVSMTTMLANISAHVDDISVVTNDTNATVAEMKEQLNAILKLFGDSGLDKNQLTEIHKKINEQDTVISDNEMKEILQNARNLERKHNSI